MKRVKQVCPANFYKKGQMEISFGMIFSIILVIFFLAAGFYGISKFIEMQQTVQIEKFSSDFKEDVDIMWKKLQGSETKTYVLPKKIISVCFRNDEFTNLEFVSEKIIPGEYVEHLNIEKITKEENPFCVKNVEGKISLILSKEYGETLVTVGK